MVAGRPEVPLWSGRAAGFDPGGWVLLAKGEPGKVYGWVSGTKRSWGPFSVRYLQFHGVWACPRGDWGSPGKGKQLELDRCPPARTPGSPKCGARGLKPPSGFPARGRNGVAKRIYA